MKRFMLGDCRTQSTLRPERLDDYIADSTPVCVVDELDLGQLGFESVCPAAIQLLSYARPPTGRVG